MKQIKSIFLVNIILIFSFGCEIFDNTIDMGSVKTSQEIIDFFNILGDTIKLYHTDYSPEFLIKNSYENKNVKRRTDCPEDIFVWKEQTINSTYKNSNIIFSIETKYHIGWPDEDELHEEVIFTFELLKSDNTFRFIYWECEDSNFFLINSKDKSLYDNIKERDEYNNPIGVLEEAYLKISRELGICSIITSMGDSLYNYNELVNIETSK